MARACFQGSERGAVGFGRRGHFILRVEIRGHPVPESRGAKGEHLPGIESGRHAGARLAIFRAERRDAASMIEQRERLSINGKAGRHLGSRVAPQPGRG